MFVYISKNICEYIRNDKYIKVYCVQDYVCGECSNFVATCHTKDHQQPRNNMIPMIPNSQGFRVIYYVISWGIPFHPGSQWQNNHHYILSRGTWSTVTMFWQDPGHSLNLDEYFPGIHDYLHVCCLTDTEVIFDMPCWSSILSGNLGLALYRLPRSET